MNEYRFSMDMVRRFGEKLRLEEKSEATVQKYTYGICRFLGIGGLGDESSFNREELLGRKERLLSENSASTVNGILSAVNRFFEFLGFYELRLKYVKRQKRIFADNRRELRRDEYMRLVRTAERDGKDRTALILQTICSTGIRVSELKYITRRLVINGKGEVNCKGKVRMIFIPRKLRTKLLKYIKDENLRGSVFVTRGGHPVDRSNIWREMKKLCGKAGVSWRKVFPHNLRHLFARTFYDREKDLSKLADLLGHSGIETTRIYIMESFAEHINMLEKMDLVV